MAELSTGVGLDTRQTAAIATTLLDIATIRQMATMAESWRLRRLGSLSRPALADSVVSILRDSIGYPLNSAEFGRLNCVCK